MICCYFNCVLGQVHEECLNMHNSKCVVSEWLQNCILICWHRKDSWCGLVIWLILSVICRSGDLYLQDSLAVLSLDWLNVYDIMVFSSKSYKTSTIFPWCENRSVHELSYFLSGSYLGFCVMKGRELKRTNAGSFNFFWKVKGGKNLRRKQCQRTKQREAMGK